MFRWIILATATLLSSQVHAGDKIKFDGICRLSVDYKQWSGVAISRTQILTVAHHDETGIVRAEFAETEHGSFNRIGVKARIIRSNRKADLSLIEYDCPEWAEVKVYPVRKLQSKAVSIRGYVESSPREDKTTLLRIGIVDGYQVNTFSGTGIPGMSGSGVLSDDSTVGIQFGGDKTTVDTVTSETIQEFLKR